MFQTKIFKFPKITFLIKKNGSDSRGTILHTVCKCFQFNSAFVWAWGEHVEKRNKLICWVLSEISVQLSWISLKQGGDDIKKKDTIMINDVSVCWTVDPVKLNSKDKNDMLSFNPIDIFTGDYNMLILVMFCKRVLCYFIN